MQVGGGLGWEHGGDGWLLRWGDPRPGLMHSSAGTARSEGRGGREYCNFRKYAHPLHVKEGIITEKVFPVFSESFFWTCFGLVMYIWELMGVTEKFAFQM